MHLSKLIHVISKTANQKTHRPLSCTDRRASLPSSCWQDIQTSSWESGTGVSTWGVRADVLRGMEQDGVIGFSWQLMVAVMLRLTMGLETDGCSGMDSSWLVRSSQSVLLWLESGWLWLSDEVMDGSFWHLSTGNRRWWSGVLLAEASRSTWREQETGKLWNEYPKMKCTQFDMPFQSFSTLFDWFNARMQYIHIYFLDDKCNIQCGNEVMRQVSLAY